MMNDRAHIEDIHEFWFGPLDQHGFPSGQRRRLWFTASDATDATIRLRFASLVRGALGGELDHWPELDRGAVALLLLLDQFTRNILRGSIQAFAGDDRALALARRVITGGGERRWPVIHRVFLYLPFEHAEDLPAQEQGVALFDQLLQDCAPAIREQVAEFRQYSVAHRDVIARFGRFPHHNAILNRPSSAAELAHLQVHGGF